MEPELSPPTAIFRRIQKAVLNFELKKLCILHLQNKRPEAKNSLRNCNKFFSLRIGKRFIKFVPFSLSCFEDLFRSEC